MQLYYSTDAVLGSSTGPVLVTSTGAIEMTRNVLLKLNFMDFFTAFFSKCIILEVHTERNIAISKHASLSSFETTTRSWLQNTNFPDPTRRFVVSSHDDRRLKQRRSCNADLAYTKNKQLFSSAQTTTQKSGRNENSWILWARSFKPQVSSLPADVSPQCDLRKIDARRCVRFWRHVLY